MKRKISVSIDEEKIPGGVYYDKFGRPYGVMPSGKRVDLDRTDEIGIRLELEYFFLYPEARKKLHGPSMRDKMEVPEMPREVEQRLRDLGVFDVRESESGISLIEEDGESCKKHYFCNNEGCACFVETLDNRGGKEPKYCPNCGKDAFSYSLTDDELKEELKRRGAKTSLIDAPLVGERDQEGGLEKAARVVRIVGGEGLEGVKSFGRKASRLGWAATYPVTGNLSRAIRKRLERSKGKYFNNADAVITGILANFIAYSAIGVSWGANQMENDADGWMLGGMLGLIGAAAELFIREDISEERSMRPGKLSNYPASIPGAIASLPIWIGMKAYDRIKRGVGGVRNYFKSVGERV